MTSPIITLVVGSEQRLFAAHEDVLSGSPFAQATYHGPPTEAATKAVSVSEEKLRISSSKMASRRSLQVRPDYSYYPGHYPPELSDSPKYYPTSSVTYDGPHIPDKNGSEVMPAGSARGLQPEPSLNRSLLGSLFDTARKLSNASEGSNESESATPGHTLSSLKSHYPLLSCSERGLIYFVNNLDSKSQTSTTSSLLKKTYERATGYRRKAVRVLVNGVECVARPDTGSDRNVMTEEFANSHRILIQRTDVDTGLFKMGNSAYVRSIGRAFVPSMVVGDHESKQGCWFHVLSKCPSPLIMGMEFIRKIQLYTKNKHLLIDCPSLCKIPTLKWIGAPQSRLDFIADGKRLTGGVDTGSDLDLMSLRCATIQGFKIDTSANARTRVMLADESIVETVGQVSISSIQLSDFNSFEMSFHVLPGLPCDVVFGEEFVDQLDAFNTCDIINGEYPYNVFLLNTLINLGPIQTFINRKLGLKKNRAVVDEHDLALEAEHYRRSKAIRLISKIGDETRREAAVAEEDVKRKDFDRRHGNCQRCNGVVPESEILR